MAINFKAAEQAVIDMLLPTLPMFKQNGMTAEQVRQMYEAQLSGVEKSAKCRIDIVDDGESFSLKTVDIGSDFIRTRPTKTALNLRAKKQNVPIVVTVVQEDKDLLLTNAEIAAGLAELAEYVAAMPVEMHKAKKADWPMTLGAQPKVSDGSLDDDDDDDDDSADQTEQMSPAQPGEMPVEDPTVGQSAAPVQPETPVATQTPSALNELPGQGFHDDFSPSVQAPQTGSVDLMSS